MTFTPIKLSLRQLSRQKLNTSLHIVGLTLAMSVCLLIGLFLRHELSFDAYHPAAARTYRITEVWTDNGKKNFHYSTPLPLTDALRAQVPGLEHVTLAHPQDQVVIAITPQKIFKQDRILVVDPEFLDVFKIEVLKGDARKALGEPYQALLTETTAQKFYGQEEPVGKTFIYNNKFNVTVAGVIRDLPGNTHLQASMLLSFVRDEDFLGNGPDGWQSVSGTEAFIVVPENYDLRKLEVPLKAMADQHINSEPGLPKEVRCDLVAQPLGDIHFDSKFAGGGRWVKALNVTWLWFFGSVGLAVLALACINFVNLSTAQAITRTKEIGIRKASGAGRSQLIAQFLREAWILSAVAGMLSIAIVQVCLPAVNTLLGKGIVFGILQSPGLMLILVSGILLTGLLAGFYPAWVITKFNPSSSLKAGSTVSGDHGSSWLRKTLVVTQFTISAGLLMALILIAQQVNFMRSKNLGFDKDNIINVELPQPEKAQLLAAALNQVAQVKDVTFESATPSSDYHWGTVMSLTDGNDPVRQSVTLVLADDHFCKMYGLKLLSGRFIQAHDTVLLGRSIPHEQKIMKAVVNETLVRALGFKSNDAALDKHFWAGLGSGNVEIVGVVADFNTSSLHQAIKPMIITQFQEYRFAGIQVVAGNNPMETVAAIEGAWKKVFPEGIFEFSFLDQQIDDFYKEETRLYTLFKVFAGIALLISCLGLWGLAAFAAQQRTKEIGIRKVLGASVNTIVMLLSKDFMVLVMIALTIASPLAYYFMKDWLQSFAYRIPISWQVFALAGMASVVIALLTISVQTLRAAWANPVESLRNE